LDQPERLDNPLNFPTVVLDIVAALMYKWFADEDLGMCRVVKLGGVTRRNDITGVDEMKATLTYEHVLDNGKVDTNTSSLSEVKEWVDKEQSNL
jgi:hypothetical protein